MKNHNLSSRLIKNSSDKFFHFKSFVAVILLSSVISGMAHAQAGGVWSPPTKITGIGAWAIWFGVQVADTTAFAPGCSGTGQKAIDISGNTAVTKAMTAVLMSAQAQGKNVTLYYGSCVNGVNIISNVQLIN